MQKEIMLDQNVNPLPYRTAFFRAAAHHVIAAWRGLNGPTANELPDDLRKDIGLPPAYQPEDPHVLVYRLGGW